jgi:glucosyl-dolichyl phosphate glucuronosyltransferase
VVCSWPGGNRKLKTNQQPVDISSPASSSFKNMQIEPAISVVICTYNRDKFIGEALNCLSRQTLSPDRFEIIVVDNNSTDNTAAITKKFIADHPDLNMRYVLEPTKGLSFARNRGMQEAKAPIITYIDDDAEATPGFLQSIVTFLQANKTVVGIGGKVIPKYSESQEPEWMSKYLNGFVGLMDYGTSPKRFDNTMKYPAGCNMTYTKDILKRAGGFNNQLTFRSDDKYIFFQVTKLSDNIYYLPEAMLYHNIDNDRLTFINFKKLFLKSGNEEKIRVRSEKGAFAVAKKFFELIFKTSASLVLYFFYSLKGMELKGRYIFFSQWYTLKGFLQKSVFVR